LKYCREGLISSAADLIFIVVILPGQKLDNFSASLNRRSNPALNFLEKIVSHMCKRGRKNVMYIQFLGKTA
jgi:hypothetical protein